MKNMTYQDILRIRQLKNRLDNGQQLISVEDAENFVNERGIILLGPIRNLPLPSLSEADRTPPEAGFEITANAWEWKEKLPGRKACMYGKFLRNKGTFISWELFAAYYQHHRTDDIDDSEEAYARGHLSRHQLQIVESLQERGPLSSREIWLSLRHAYHGERPKFVKDLEALQQLMLIAVCGGSLEGWSCHHWDLMNRHIPADITNNPPDVETSQRLLLSNILQNMVACLPREAASILRLRPDQANHIAAFLPVREVCFPDRPGKHWLWDS